MMYYFRKKLMLTMLQRYADNLSKRDFNFQVFERSLKKVHY